MGDTGEDGDICTDDILLNEESLLNSTQDIVSKGLLLKSDSLNDDIKRIVKYVQPSKRSAMVKKLDVESFRFDIYSQRQSGFCTSAPIGWAIAIEKYIERTATTTCRWVHKDDKSTLQITSSELDVWFNTTDRVKIIIEYMQGYLMVKGPLYKEWIDTEFPKVLREMESNVFL